MRVLHLPFNLASQMSVTVRALRDIGVDARGVVLNNPDICSDSGIINYIRSGRRRHPVRGLFQTARWWCAVLRHILWADVVHWHWTSSTMYTELDLRAVKSLGRPRLVEFWGSDIRIPEIASRDNPYIAQMYREHPELGNGCGAASLKSQEKFHRYGFACTVADDELQSYLQREYFPTPYRVRQRVLLEDYVARFPSPANRRPILVHCPSSKAKKGTEAVLKAVENLRGRHDFEFRLVHGVPRNQALAMMAECDLYLDQFTIGAHGLAALEAMAFGKPVLCYIKPSLVGTYPTDMPIVNANQDNLAQVLEPLLRDGTLRHDIGRRSRAYVEKYHDAHKLARELVGIYEELIEKQARGRR